MNNTGEWEDVKNCRIHSNTRRFLMCLAIHPLQGTVQELQRRNVPVGACWPHEVELLSFLTLLCALGGICLVLDCTEIPSVCAPVSVLLLATHQVVPLSFMLLLAFISRMINWIIDMDQLERNQVFCHLRLCSVPRPYRSYAYTIAVLAQIEVKTLFLSGE